MRIVPLNLKDHGIEALMEAVQVLRQGGTVVVPTDTLYGLAADARNEEAIGKVVSVKGREEGEPISVLVLDPDMVDAVAVASERVRDILASSGDITAVLPSRGWMPLRLRGREGLTIGVRIPNHQFLQRLIKSFGGPITGTSANRSGRSGQTKIQDVLDDFAESGREPDLVIDAGDLPERSASIVVDFTVNPPKILRAGALTLDQLKKLLGTEFI